MDQVSDSRGVKQCDIIMNKSFLNKILNNWKQLHHSLFFGTPGFVKYLFC